MKRIDYCLHIIAHNGCDYEKEMYFRIGELVDLNIEKFKRACLSTTEITKALSCELIPFNDHLQFDCFELIPVCCLSEVQKYNLEFFRDVTLQQSIDAIRKKHNDFLSWNEQDNIPIRALLIGVEVIPILPIPDDYIEDFQDDFDPADIKDKDNNHYRSNEPYEIVLYDNLSRKQQRSYSVYGNYLFSERDNLEYLNDLVEGIEDFARNDFERKLRTSACQESAAPFASYSPTAPASADITSIRPYPQISAKGDEVAPAFGKPDNDDAGMVVACNTARVADNSDKQIELQKKQIDQTDKLIELKEREIELLQNRQHTANNTASDFVTDSPAAVDDAPTVPASDLIANDPQADKDYTKTKDHKERRILMSNDGIKPSDISRWEKNHRTEISTSDNPLPSTDVDAIKKFLQRQRKKAGTK